MNLATTSSAHLLIVDDDARISSLLKKFLERDGFSVSTAPDAARARRLMSGLQFDLVILDVMMPGEDGFSLTRAIREETDLPIILLTARDAQADRIEGLRRGADDYLAKPFEPEELLLRIEAILRRARSTRPAEDVAFGDWHLDRMKAQIRGRGGHLALSTSEMTILTTLAGRLNQPVARHELAEATGTSQERSIDVAITRLRKKLGEDPRNPRWLQTVRGSGYRLVGQYVEA